MSWDVAPILGCRDVRTTAYYFRDVLGFHLDPETGVFDGVDANEGAVYAIVDRERVRIHLQIRRRDVFAGPREGIESDAYVYVDDADALHEEYAGKAVTIVRAIEDAPYGFRDFTIEDPEGHRIVFGSPIGRGNRRASGDD
jgi:uncharacterized glyoxalase superfamily protein PhnB